jgi:hypothetical protein
MHLTEESLQNVLIIKYEVKSPTQLKNVCRFAMTCAVDEMRLLVRVAYPPNADSVDVSVSDSVPNAA